MATDGPSRGLFDLWSTFYDLPLVQRLTYLPVQDAVVSALRPFAPRRVLDVGCGTGLLATRLRAELPAATIAGCDFSHGMLRHAHDRDPAGSWVQGDAQRLPIRDASVDAIVSTEAFHWFPDKDRALAETFRVLVPGGPLLVAIVNTPHAAVRTIVQLASRVAGQPFDWPTRADMRALCERAGFRVEAQRRVFRIPAGLSLPPVLTIAVRPR